MRIYVSLAVKILKDRNWNALANGETQWKGRLTAVSRSSLLSHDDHGSSGMTSECCYGALVGRGAVARQAVLCHTEADGKPPSDISRR